jgi:biopolymer transport protein ExbD/biopolymer transport protein TolR
MKAPGLKRSLYEPLAEINVTPFVDVMLVLLIVFMITAPMLAAGMRVELPQAKTAQPLEPKEPVIITIQKEGKIFLGQDEVAAGQIAEAVRVKTRGDRERAIHLRGDREVVYGEVVSIMDQLGAHGFAKVSLLASAQRRERGRSQDAPPVDR